MSKHTPGPWIARFKDSSIKIIDKVQANRNYGRLADVQSWTDTRYGPSRSEAEHNAYLMAAAPDLLEALWMVLDDPYALDGRPRTYEVVCAAIAKASGEV